MNKKAEFAVKILKVYAKQNQTLQRCTSDLSKLEEWLILELMKVNNINYTRCCESDSEQLHTEVFKLANKLAVNGYGNEAVKMHQICNGM